MNRVCLLLVLLTAFAPPARGALAVLLGEPFGSFGTMMPTGHVSLYLDRVCADGPERLRMCRAGEPHGVVLARLDAIEPLDWIASPVMSFLYGVEDADQVIPFATERDVRALQDDYRRRNLLELFPDEVEKTKASDEWWETVGAAYVRRIWGYQIATTPQQDERFVARMNDAENSHRYHLHRANCADFIADAVNFYFPGTVQENKLADFHVMSPKQVVRSVEQFGKTHPEANLQVFVIPQIPGTLRRSRPVRGGTDMLLKTKRYVFTLLAIQPEAVVAALVMYLGARPLADRTRRASGSPAVVCLAERREREPCAPLAAGAHPNSPYLRGISIPKWAYASFVATRPLGVRSRNPIWIRNGS